MQRKVLVMAALAVLGTLGIAGASEWCSNADVSELPPPVPVLDLAETRLTLLAPSETPVGFGAGEPDSHACEGKIRPGAKVVFNNAYRCSLNWIYADNAGVLYAGTAGHCLASGCAPNLVTNIVIAGIGDIGDGFYSTGNCGVGNDFALIKIDPALYSFVDPTLCHWGGPKGMATANPVAVLHYGWGNAYDDYSHTRARAGVVDSFAGSYIEFQGGVAPGDSGSALMGLDGKAAGVITHTWTYTVPVGFQYASRVDVGLARANAALPGKDIRVLDSSVPVDLTGLLVPP